jgi:hypothetical protein
MNASRYLQSGSRLLKINIRKCAALLLALATAANPNGFVDLDGVRKNAVPRV